MLTEERDVLFIRAMCLQALGRPRAALMNYAMAFAADDKHLGYHQMAWCAVIGSHLDDAASGISFDAVASPEVKECFAKRLGKHQRPAGYREPSFDDVRPDNIVPPPPIGISATPKASATKKTADIGEDSTNGSSPFGPSSGDVLVGTLGFPRVPHVFGRMPKPVSTPGDGRSRAFADSGASSADASGVEKHVSLDEAWFNRKSFIGIGHRLLRLSPAPLVGYGSVSAKG